MNDTHLLASSIADDILNPLYNNISAHKLTMQRLNGLSDEIRAECQKTLGLVLTEKILVSVTKYHQEHNVTVEDAMKKILKDHRMCTPLLLEHYMACIEQTKIETTEE